MERLTIQVYGSIRVYGIQMHNNLRDCGNPKERYSSTQMEYFGKPPSERWEVIRHWIEDEEKGREEGDKA